MTSRTNHQKTARVPYANVLVFLFCLICPSYVLAEKLQLSIQSQSLHDAILELVQISNQPILFQASITSGKTSPALQGSFTMAQALNKLLKGSGLKTKKLGDAWVIVSSKPQASVDVPVQPAVVEAPESDLVYLEDSLGQDQPDIELNNTAMSNKGQTPAAMEMIDTDIDLSTSGGIGLEPGASDIDAIDERDPTAVDATTLAGQTTVEAIEAKKSKEAILVILDKKGKQALYEIYTQALKEEPELKGGVKFQLTITPDGTVSRCDILFSNLGDASLESQLIERLSKIHFNTPIEAATSVKWDIQFLPKKQIPLD